MFYKCSSLTSLIYLILILIILLISIECFSSSLILHISIFNTINILNTSKMFNSGSNQHL